MDEAGRTPFAELPDFLVTLRSRRISCAVLVQALSQLRAAYGQQASTILGNCSVHIYARSEDIATAEYISERIGTAEEIIAIEARSAGPTGRSVTHGQLRRFRPLLTSQEVWRMQDHQVIAFLPACPSAALTRMDWREHPALRQRSEMRPPERTPLEVVAPSPPPWVEPLTGDPYERFGRGVPGSNPWSYSTTAFPSLRLSPHAAVGLAWLPIVAALCADGTDENSGISPSANVG